jgi:uncharacterized repeat protein (TIGR02543 family)
MSFTALGCDEDWLTNFFVQRMKDALVESEYFIYCCDEEDDNLQIMGLTDKGKEQEYLIIPEKIDGITVARIGCGNGISVRAINEKFGVGHAQLESENLKKVFFINNVTIKEGFGGKLLNSPLLEGVFFISEKYYRLPVSYSYVYGWNQIISNVSYFYNYDNAPNDNYYWIDDYDYGEKISFIPPEPTRACYTFGGWYKESECINKWNFEIDALPSALYGEDNLELYQETKLYAKWIEIT